MKFKPLLIFMLTCCLVFAGCASGGDGNSAKKPNPTQTVNQNVKPKVALKFFVHGPNNSVMPQGDADFVKKKIEEKFNVQLDIQFMEMSTDRTNKLNLLLAGGDAPDVFTALGSDSQKYIFDNIAADMTPFVTPQTMPNYFKYWVDEMVLKRLQIENKFARAPVPYTKTVYRSYYVRKDWLDNLGMKVPETYDEMMEVIRAFRNKDPDGNGKKDTYGFSTAGNGTTVSWDFPQWIKHGLIGSFMIENNKLIDNQTDPRVEHVLNDIKAMLKEDVVDPDWFLTKGTQYTDKAIQGKVGIVLGGDQFFALDGDPQSVQNRTKAINPKADWVPFHPFAKTGTWSEVLPDTAFLFSKTAAEKDPEKIKRAVEVLDWMASEEGYLLIHHGLEGKHYTKQGNTIKITKQQAEQFKKDVADRGDFLKVYQFFSPEEPQALKLEVIDERYTDRDREILKKIQSYKLIPSLGTSVAPPQGFNLADFRKKMREYQIKILFDEPDASNWPKYREELMTKFGGNEMPKVYEDQVRAAGVIK